MQYPFPTCRIVRDRCELLSVMSWVTDNQQHERHFVEVSVCVFPSFSDALDLPIRRYRGYRVNSPIILHRVFFSLQSGVMRSQSLSSANLASSPKTSASPRVVRSKPMSAPVRRSYPAAATASESDKKLSDSPRRRGPISSTSDDSDMDSSDVSQSRQVKDYRRRSEESERKGVQLIPEKEGKRPFSAPRPNKTAMLRAHNSRAAVKNSGVKNKSPTLAKVRIPKNSPQTNSGNDSLSPSARVWSPSPKRSIKSSTGDDNREVGENGAKSDAEEVCSSPADDVTQEAVDEVFTSGPVRPLPESLQMKRDDTVNKTFVLGKGSSTLSLTRSCISYFVEPRQFFLLAGMRL